MAKQNSGKAEERPRGGSARPLADMLPRVSGMAFRRFGFVQSAIVTRWDEIVGERYARVSSPDALRFPHGKREGGTLSVTIIPAHAAMMQHVLPAIIERVNRFFGYQAVAKIVLRQGEITRPPVRVERPAPAPLAPELGEQLKPIADPELRAVLEALARGVAARSDVPVMGKIS